MIYGFESEFVFGINGWVKKKKKKNLMQIHMVSYKLEGGWQLALPCPNHGESSPFGTLGSWELLLLVRDFLLGSTRF